MLALVAWLILVFAADRQEALSHAYDTEETTATARDTILTATPLSHDLKAQIVMA